jgi:probable addiction module antidote protein
VSNEPPFDSAIYRDNPEAISDHLNEAFASDELPVLITAIKRVMRAQNVLALSEETGLQRENLYRTFRGDVDPRLSIVLRLFSGMGVQLMVRPRDSIKQKSPRPKPGPRPSIKIPRED